MCTYIHSYIHTFVHSYIRTFIHSYIHTYIIRSCIHTCMLTCIIHSPRHARSCAQIASFGNLNFLICFLTCLHACLLHLQSAAFHSLPFAGKPMPCFDSGRVPVVPQEGCQLAFHGVWGLALGLRVVSHFEMWFDRVSGRET